MGSTERALFRSATFVAIQNEDGEYLLQRRANTGFMDGHYDLASGHLEYDESYEESAARETKEEFGIDVNPSDLEISTLFQSNFEPGVSYLNIIFRATKFTGIPIIGEPEKIDHIDWFAPSHFPEKLTIGTWVFLNSLGSLGVKNYNIDREKYKEIMGKYYE